MEPRELAHGVRWSGLDRLLEEGNSIARSGFDQVASAVMGHAAASREGFDQICAMLAQQSGVLASIEHLVRNPKATEADEYYRRGLRALRAGWFPEAVTDLQLSVGINPYAPLTQFALGLALGATNQTNEAADAFNCALRYSSDMPSLNSVACGAAILGGRAYLNIARREMAVELARTARSRVQDCAELELFWAGVTADATATVKALNLAPELAELAVTDSMPGANDAAARLAQVGTIASLNRAEDLRSQLNGRPRALVVEGSARAIAHGYRAWADTHAREVRVELDEFREELARLEKSVAWTRNDAARRPEETPPAPALLWLALIVGGVGTGVFAGINGSLGSMLFLLLFYPFILVGLGALIVRYSPDASKKIKSELEQRQRADKSRAELPRLEERLANAKKKQSIADELETVLGAALPRRTYPLTQAQ